MSKDIKRVLIIDALNMYYRAYIVDPSLSTNGQPIGGMKGFIKILQKMLREMKPDQIIIAWDGDGGSKKRRIINKNYKSGRKPIRLNRDIRNMSEQEEIQNKIWQQTRLIGYLNEMPINQIVLDGVEADDVIAYIVQLPSFKDHQKIIISSDKDYIQLCDDKTVLFRPVQKEILNKKRIVDSYGIHPLNFALARAIVGDKSDNLKGVGSVGLKTVAKRFPFLSEEKSYMISEIVDVCKNSEEDLKVYTNILENKKVVEQNYKMMQLYSPNISIQGKQKVRTSVEEMKNTFNKTKVVKMMIEDGFGTYDWTDLFQTFKRVVVKNKNAN